MADLHTHSTFIDGTEPVEEIIKIYGEAASPLLLFQQFNVTNTYCRGP